MSTPGSAFSSALLALLVLATLLDLLGSARGQNYHYSNGWHPGKRGDDDGGASLVKPAVLFGSSLTGPSDRQSCHARMHVLRVLNDLITDELARLDRRCSSHHAVDLLKMLIELSLLPSHKQRGEEAEEEDEDEQAEARRGHQMVTTADW